MLAFGVPPYYECSSVGDKRFSAFYAQLWRGRWKSIEEIYQGAKVFEDGSTNLYWREAKGRRAVNQEEVAAIYTELWIEYIKKDPELLDVLKAQSGLSDKFGKPGGVCQAEVLWRIRNGEIGGNEGH